MRKLGKRPQQIFAFVATPAYDGRVYTDYTLSLADSVAMSCHAAQLGITELPIKTHVGIMGNGAFIEISRNTFVKMFLDTKCTHLFFIDGDLRWEPRAFCGLLAANKPIAAGMYRRRQEPENYPVVLQPHPETGGPWIVDGGWIQCKRVPTGFLCIRRDVVEEMAKEARVVAQPNTPDFPELPWLFGTKFDAEGRFVGEDFTFCDAYIEKYKEYIPVWADFDFTHAGFKCNFLEFLNKPDMADGAIKKINDAAHDNSGVMKIGVNEPDGPQLTVVKGGK